jgi:hypothetical protein
MDHSPCVMELKMSDPRPEKKAREKGQVRAFLGSRLLSFKGIEEGQDPPDVQVIQDGFPALNIEITEYHAEVGRVGIEKRWRQLAETIYDLIKQRPALKGVSADPIFLDHRIPSRIHHGEIACELLRCAEFVLDHGWLEIGNRKLSFQSWVSTGLCYPITPSWTVLPASEWPTLAKHVSAVTVSKIDFAGFLPSNNPQAQSAYSSPYAGAFLSLLEEKEDSIRRAIRTGKYAKSNSALLLLIVCNTRGDLSSEIFGDWQIKPSLDECGFDFQNSVFDEIWLMDEIGGGKSQRLHPWDDRIHAATSRKSGT